MNLHVALKQVALRHGWILKAKFACLNTNLRSVFLPEVREHLDNPDHTTTTELFNYVRSNPERLYSIQTACLRNGITVDWVDIILQTIVRSFLLSGWKKSVYLMLANQHNQGIRVVLECEVPQCAALQYRPYCPILFKTLITAVAPKCDHSSPTACVFTTVPHLFASRGRLTFARCQRRSSQVPTSGQFMPIS